MARDYIDEIRARRSRSDHTTYNDFKLTEVGNLVQMIEGLEMVPFNKNEIKSVSKEIKKYIPIAIVACYENFFRAICKDLIDHGEPFRSNAKELKKRDIKFNFDIVTAIESETITIGEFISHLLPFNNLADINSNISTLIGNDFLSSLEKFNRQSIFDHVNTLQKDFHTNEQQIIRDARYVFELRHIYCHEYNPKNDITVEELKRIFSSCVLLQEFIELFISETLYPNSPETQAEITAAAYNDLSNVEHELKALIEKIKKSFGKVEFNDLDPKLFDEMVSSWKIYNDKRAFLFGEEIGEGTLRGSVEAFSREKVTQEFIDSLKESFRTIDEV